MTDRKTASTINDAELDQLYRDLDALRAECRAWAEAESADIAAGSYAGRVEELQGAIARVRALHVNSYGLCDECTGSHGVPWPCPTIQALDQPTPAATQPTGRLYYCPTTATVEDHTRHCCDQPDLHLPK
ncbi:hypothetical protein [Streptomyces sp. NRRL S-1022]|uniref:hypothetical protein n=1 Tax=Streptomyces sp. NRRL S-1022 TaxID=1463880 RepID=UPI0004C1D659|nr:hypothetical protein [Streptomyces sp. NRRL S-1022]